MNKFLTIFLMISLFTLTLLGETKPLEKVSIQLNWKNQFQFAGYYMAKEKGYFKNAGLDVEIKEFSNGINVVESVVDENSTFGVIYTNVLLNADKVVLLSAIYNSSPHVLVSLKSSNIHSLEDFKNKKIMITNEGAQSASIISMLHSRGVLLSDMILQKPNFDVESLINKETDIGSYFLTNELYKLDKLGIEYNVWNPKDYGFNFYSDLLFTSRAFLKKRPEIVESFTKASLRGWKYALSHIDETVAVILDKYNTQHKSEGALLYEARVSKNLILSQTTSLGQIERDKIQRMIDIYSFLRVLDKSVDIDSLIYKMPVEEFNKEEKEYLQKKKVIRMCVDPNWMPLEALENGKYVGVVSEYFDIFEKKFNLPIEVVNTKSWSETLENAKEHKCDMVSLANKTNLRKKYLNFTDPYLKVSVVMATKMGNSYIGDLRKLSNKKVAIVKNYAFIDFVKLNYPNLEIVEVENINDGLDKVYEGELYGYIGALPTIAYALQTKFANSLKIVGQIDAQWSLSVGVRSDDETFYNIMQKVVGSIDEKTKSNIISKWMSVKYEKGTDYRLIYIIVAVFLFIFFVGSFFYFKLIKLKNRIEKQKDKLIESHHLLQEREKELKLLASTDSMTKLYNRRAFGEISESIFNIAKREKQKLSVIMLDIDNFKKINDTYGHKVGDSVIILLSEKLKELSRESDVVCRFGGEEFIMLLPYTDSKGGYFIAQKIKSVVEESKLEDTALGELKFTISLGVSEIILEKDGSIEAVIKRADDALYESKRSGKNRVTIA